MRYFLDTEFIEDGSTIDLISIGMVREDGRELYMCNTEAKLHLASDWVRTNVLPQLPSYGDDAWQDKRKIASDVRSFMDGFGRIDLVKDKPEMWAYYADYDWVAFCQLFGRMLDLPKGYPKFCMDLKQLSVMRGSPQHPPQQEGKHNALADARYNRDLYAFLMQETL